MDNRSIAQLLADTAELLEISAGDPFRIRSYRRAAEAVESSTIQLSEIAGDIKKLLEIPGIGKGMAANIQEIDKSGTLPLREELLTKYKPGMLDLLKLPGMGPKSVLLFWEALQIASISDLEAAIAAGAAIHTLSPVRSAERAGKIWRLKAGEGIVTADWVVVATDAYSEGSPWPQGKREQVRVPYFNFATRPLAPDLAASILPGREGCWDTRMIMNSFRFDRAGRLLFGSVGALRLAGVE